MAGNPFDNVLHIPPYSKGEFQLVYRPSALGGDDETCTVIFDHVEAGTWVFECSGRGRPPSDMDVTNVFATVMHSSSNMIRFRNPLREHIDVTVNLVHDDLGVEHHAQAFQLLMPADEPLHLAPFREIDIPVLFSPTTMVEHSCQLVVCSMAEDIKWVYPIIGTAEAQSCVHLGKLTCRARESLRHSFTVELSGAVNVREDEKILLQVHAWIFVAYVFVHVCVHVVVRVCAHELRTCAKVRRFYCTYCLNMLLIYSCVCTYACYFAGMHARFDHML